MDIDLTAPAHDADPFSLFDQLRQIGPVVRSDRQCSTATQSWTSMGRSDGEAGSWAEWPGFLRF